MRNLLICLAFLVAACKEDPDPPLKIEYKTSADVEKERRERASLAAAMAKRDAERVAEQARAAASQTDESTPGRDHEAEQQGNMMIACRNLVKQNLHAPDDAEFPGILFDAVPRPVVTLNPDHSIAVGTWRAWVKAPNLYGVKLKRWFTCRVKGEHISFKMEG